MLLKEIMNPDSDARKSKHHINYATDKSVTDDISQRLIAKGINPHTKKYQALLAVIF
jgi:hypothetical protein